MNYIRSRFAISLILAGVACLAPADFITVQLLPNTQSVVQGGEVSFLANLTNTTLDSYDLNSLQVSLPSSTLSADTTPFFTNFPITLDPVSNNPSSGILFTVKADQLAALGNYSGTVELFGTKTGSGQADSLLGSDQFTVSVKTTPPVPEPATMIGLAVGCGLVLRRRTAKSAR